jgi:hypothetical protein
MKKIISIIVIVLFTISIKLYAQNTVAKNDKVQTKKEQCCNKGSVDKKCDKSKCPNSATCKMQCNNSDGTNQICKSKCKDMSKCMNGSSKCDSTMCKGNMRKCKTMNNCPMMKK